MAGVRRIGRTGRTRRLLAGVAVGAALVLAGCSEAPGSGAADAGGSAAEAPAASEGSDVERSGGSPVRDQDGGTAGRTAVQTRQVISIGTVTLEADDLAEVRSGLDRLLGRYGGFVADEETSNDEEGATQRSVLTLRVPSRHFETVMGAFDELATVIDTGREATDVTTEVIDVASRIRTQEVSLDRLRGFLGRATDVNAMIRLESEIARRESDLASLRAQQEYLDDQTSLATITVTMATPDEADRPEEDPLEDAGFLAGLDGGWNALVDVLVVLATVVGALVPFALVLGVLGVPLLVWLRTARRRRVVRAGSADGAA
ncbi:DUF4349 domain-containing protein [Nocardioides caldifontis]|uniref:DUF4349 domain-containing protein n=1 Tax=Nocardioides caldifontis TaxID=2588938 RepID=UPI0011DF6835|nr:DUF4349 domain-containing protein [Nocardioides caldifontis]